MAPHVASTQEIDFSRLARSLGNNNLMYPGDVLDVSVATGLEEKEPLSTKVRVSEAGTISVPLVGSVHVVGLDLAQAERAIHAESIRSGKFVDPIVSVRLATRKSNRVTVVGAVEEPGTYELPVHNSDMLLAVVMAGGLTEEAGTVVEIRHPPRTGSQNPLQDPNGYPSQFSSFGPGAVYPDASPRLVRVDLQQASVTGAGDLHVEDGSTIMVARKPKRFVHVIGLVNKADQFEMPEDQELRLLDALALAGGRTMEIADKVQIVRQTPNQAEPVIIEASVREAKASGMANLRLTAGDVVSVEETPLTFTVGTIRDFVRFGFSSALPMF